MDALDTEKTMAPGAGFTAGVSLAPGNTLGQYEIIRLLGRGGMGEVYEARHVDLGTTHAVKIILQEFTDLPRFRSRFRQEATLMAKLHHPSIVHVSDSGEEGGHRYLVMDCIKGPYGDPVTLRQVMTERQAKGELLEEDEAIAVGLEICEALAYAHGFHDELVPNGIVHRDLKPANILLDADTQLYIADFGLAQLIGPEFERSVIEQSMSPEMSYGDDRTALPHDGGVAGTFDYMSPEQREGRSADRRSDVYAMGAILYELLTGRKVAGVPRKPSEVTSTLDSDWDEILMGKSLAYDPDTRFQSARNMLRAIKEIADRNDATASGVPPEREKGLCGWRSFLSLPSQWEAALQDPQAIARDGWRAAQRSIDGAIKETGKSLRGWRSLFSIENRWETSWQNHLVIVRNYWRSAELWVDDILRDTDRTWYPFSRDLRFDLREHGRSIALHAHVESVNLKDVACRIFAGGRLIGGDVDKPMAI